MSRKLDKHWDCMEGLHTFMYSMERRCCRSFIDLERARVHMIVCTAHVRVHFWVYKLNRVSGFSLDFLFTHHRQAALYRSCDQPLCAAPSRLIAAPDPVFGLEVVISIYENYAVN